MRAVSATEIGLVGPNFKDPLYKECIVPLARTQLSCRLFLPVGGLLWLLARALSPEMAPNSLGRDLKEITDEGIFKSKKSPQTWSAKDGCIWVRAMVSWVVRWG